MTSTKIYQPLDYAYANNISRLRGAQLIALLLQNLVLYLESDRIGLIALSLPFTLIMTAIYVVGSRWFHLIDGRFDFRQVLYVHDSQLRLTYAFHLFGGFVAALLIHFLSPAIHSGLHSLLYNMGDFLSVFTSFVCLGVEMFESLRAIN